MSGPPRTPARLDGDPAGVDTDSMPSARTRLVVLVGDPVSHSLSPRIQNAAFRAAGVDGVYVALRAGEEELPGLIRGVARAGGCGNVTLPLKERAASLVEEATDAVRRTGACNTFWYEDGRIHGDNTDVEGFRGASRDFLDGRTPDHVLLLGAGGAARSILVALLDEGVGTVSILNRTVERARAVARRIGGDRVRVLETPDAIDGVAYDLVVNATRLGLSDDDPLPVEPARVGEPGGVFDLVYRPGETEWVRRFRDLGVPALDGGEMLVRQGAAAFRRWWSTPAPVEVMRAALRDAGGG